MKKIYNLMLILLIAGGSAFAATTAFDSMDKAIEVKLAPALKTQSSTTAVQNTKPTTSTIQVQKYNSALVNLDDAQVELRQDLAVITSKYNEAINEKQRAIQNCKNLKKEIRAINKKMKNVDKSKKMINANLETMK